jgi:hypothetical protein
MLLLLLPVLLLVGSAIGQLFVGSSFCKFCYWLVLLLVGSAIGWFFFWLISDNSWFCTAIGWCCYRLVLQSVSSSVGWSSKCLIPLLAGVMQPRNTDHPEPLNLIYQFLLPFA